MDVIFFVVALVALGALALRFGQDSREGIRSQEHDLATRGVSWNDRARDRGLPASGPAIPSVRPAYPILAFIEGGLGVPAGSLTASPDAARLEVLARDLTTEYWVDAVWTTGVVSEAGLRRVLVELAPSLADAPVLAIEPAADAAGPSPFASPVVAVGQDRPAEAWAPTAARLAPSGN